MAKGDWLNNTKIVDKATEKPCHTLGWCPYGQLVEEFPFSQSRYSCKIYGHDCPAYYHREDTTEGDIETIVQPLGC